MVAERIRPWVAAGETVLVVGDVNAGMRSTPARIIAEEGLEFVTVPGSTYHWNRGLNITPAIDHIAATDTLEATGDATIITRRFEGDWPSDHYPVFVDFRWK